MNELPGTDTVRPIFQRAREAIGDLIIGEPGDAAIYGQVMMEECADELAELAGFITEHGGPDCEIVTGLLIEAMAEITAQCSIRLPPGPRWPNDCGLSTGAQFSADGEFRNGAV